MTTIALVVAVVGSGLVGGVMLAFSAMVMPALARRPAADAVAVMQAVNVAAVRPPFLPTFLLAAVACLWVGVDALLGGVDAVALVGALLYLGGAVGLTAAYHVPRNDKLAGLDGAAAVAYWPTYLREWTRANHVRAVLCAAACACLAASIGGGPV